MAIFGWISATRELPSCWDLRTRGWIQCDAGSEGEGSLAARIRCPHIVLVDAPYLSQRNRLAMLAAHRQTGRFVMLGIEDALERAQLITGGCGEALPATTTLCELDARARRIAEMLERLPRRRSTGPLTLDLFHRDGRIGARWLGLHPREFSLLWRLADRPGERVTRTQLLRDVWRLDRDPETNRVEVHVSRLRGKLARLGCAALIETVPTGGYRMARQVSFDRVDSRLDALPEA